MIVTSKSFENNGRIPQKHTGFGENVSPELIIADTPKEAEYLAITLTDLDVPFLKSFTHWIMWNIPMTDIIPEGLPKGATIKAPICACQGAAWGKHRYRGPKQPFFIRNEHRYVFTVYALDSRLDIPERSRRKTLMNAMQGHILAEARLIGKYKRGWD